MMIELIKKHEGFKSHLYLCTEGKYTIGYGWNLDAGIDKELAEMVLRHQVFKIWMTVDAEFPWFKYMTHARQSVVVNMVFNLGMTGFKKFKKTISYLESHDYLLASEEMLDSKWATQVGARANELSEILATGQAPS